MLRQISHKLILTNKVHLQAEMNFSIHMRFMNEDNTMITFTALVPKKSDQDLILESLIGEIKARPSKEIKMSLKLEEIKHYYECPEHKGLTRLVTTDDKTFTIDEEWGMFDWRYKQETGQNLHSWQEYYTNDGNTIRTFSN